MRKIFGYIKLWLNRHSRMRQAKKYGVPFCKRMWYNYRAMLPKDILSEKSFIEIFDESGRYIDCPGIGGEVVYNNRGERYRYRVVGFKNESRYRDWLYDTDYIHPVVEFMGKS